MNCFNRIAFRFILVFILAVAHTANLVTAEELDNSDAKELVNGAEGSIHKPELIPYFNKRWIGQGVCYGPYRENESPGGQLPTIEGLTEDLELIAGRWNLIRMYGSSEVAEDALKIIKAKNLPLRVMLGAWITRETEGEDEGSPRANPSAQRSNWEETMAAVRLANAYPEVVVAVSVGNETQVFWSDHRVNPESLIQYIRTVRQGTKVPVTTADDFNFWNKTESKAIAQEVDFIVTHIHPLWAGVQLPEALPWTQRIYRQVCKEHPEKMVVLGETGWATQVHNEGEQTKRIKGKVGEAEQREYYEQFTKWANKEKICTFFFEAFDEPWKGGPHPNEVEKHWGLYFVDRTPKAALSRNTTPR